MTYWELGQLRIQLLERKENFRKEGLDFRTGVLGLNKYQGVRNRRDI